MLLWGAAALGWSVALAYFDHTRLRLPDWLTLPGVIVALGACWVNPCALWGLLWPSAYLVAGPGVGGGDVKLAVPLGVACALLAGVGAVLAALLAASLFTLVAAGITRRRRLAHGPSMLAAAWLVGLYALAQGDL
ncbi:prepilin peptidase [Corynebacterium lipophiloflavum]|uniref:Peptidase, A24 family n=1 Tax=Corynebacterium lipophiloflavum (strain ATCC 700352 / DSM 44291 / CCUG 37336 / JCM 10383 / DMMZ 1944) TaxID=525263 RepID=C0XSS6_CORLD|nr:prepilin peptidase [Corynebacterium lipophiloflavum]EEI16706.1 peptidase, A24 family [Corynebacterium lipophiloflavum DSM 44291]